jgi:hypothetical protein
MQNMPEEDLMEKEVALAAEIEYLLPDFVNSCRDKANVVIIQIIHQAFAADYQDHECALLGKPVKFAGLHGKEVRIAGKNRETLKRSESIRIAAMRECDQVRYESRRSQLGSPGH